MFNRPSILCLLVIRSDTLYHSVSLFSRKGLNLPENWEVVYVSHCLSEAVSGLLFPKRVQLSKALIWHKTKCTSPDSTDFSCFTTGLCPLRLLWMSLFLLSLHYTDIFYNNSITNLWLVPTLPEGNLQVNIQSEFVPELGKELWLRVQTSFQYGDLKGMSIFTPLLFLLFLVPFNTIRLSTFLVS